MKIPNATEILLRNLVDTYNPVLITELSLNVPYLASEFLVYDIKKLYLAIELKFGKGASGTTAQLLQFYDNANVLNAIWGDIKPTWNTTSAAMNYYNGITKINNIFFSRFLSTQIDWIAFIGFKLTLP